MKAFVIILIILVALGGAAFIYGWVSLFIPADTYCVGFSKTYGFDEFITRPGEFSWRWERLIPTNFTLYKFKLEPKTERIQLKGDLPSATVYSSVLPESPDFRYDLEVSLTLMVKPSSLPSLVKDQYLRPKNLEDWMKTKTDAILARVPQALSDMNNAEDYYNPSSLRKAIDDVIEQNFPEIRLLDFTVENLHVPDIRLYQKARETYFSLLEAEKNSRERVLRAAEQQRLVDTIQAEKEKEKLDLLREYGKLFNEYPILLKYLQLKESGKLPEDLPKPGNLEKSNG